MIDVKELFEEYGIKRIRQKGNELQFCCPFHDDRNPSASLNIELGIYNCFSCGARGTLVDFIAQMEGISFVEAKTKAAVRGISKKR